MYELKEVRLTNGPAEKNILKIEFNDPSMAIIGEFLMSDSTLLKGSILEDIDLVLTGNREYIQSSGNRCALEIKADQTIIEDLFADMFTDFVPLPTYKIDTSLLRGLIVMWYKELADFS